MEQTILKPYYEEDKLQPQVMDKVNSDLNNRSACMEFELLFRYYDYINKSPNGLL